MLNKYFRESLISIKQVDFDFLLIKDNIIQLRVNDEKIEINEKTITIV